MKLIYLNWFKSYPIFSDLKPQPVYPLIGGGVSPDHKELVYHLQLKLAYLSWPLISVLISHPIYNQITYGQCSGFVNILKFFFLC